MSRKKQIDGLKKEVIRLRKENQNANPVKQQPKQPEESFGGANVRHRGSRIW
jgi:hypothetical protein